MNIEQQDVWSLIQNGYFEQACKNADVEYEQSGNLLPLRNKIYALLHLKKYNECVLLTRQIIELRGGQTDTDYIFCGIAYWLLDQKEEATFIWQKGEQSVYKDAAGGMDLQTILYFSSIKLGDDVLKRDAIKKIKKLLKSKRSLNWPGPLGRFIVGDIEESTLLSSVADIPVFKERQLCQAHFVISVKELEKGAVERYKSELQNCISYGPSSYLEQIYYLAKGELEAMQ